MESKASEQRYTIDAAIRADRTQLAGKRVLVTGGASGLGAAFVRMFAAEKAYVVFADLNSTLGETVERELIDLGHRVKFVRVDVSSWSSQVAMFAAALRFLPSEQIDIVIACAGTAGHMWDNSPVSPSSLMEALKNGSEPPAPESTCFDVGLIGSYYTVQLAVKYGMGLHALPKGSGGQVNGKCPKSIVLFGSMASYRNIPGRIDYTGNKWGTRGLFISLRTELPRLGVRVNMMAPYWVATPMTRDLLPALEKQGLKVGTMDDNVEALAQISVNDNINGRAICVTVEGMVDLRDDLDGKCQGVVISGLTERGALLPMSWSAPAGI